MRIVSLGDMVKKVVYIFGVCILSVMIFHEFQKNAPEEAAENVAVFKESSSDPEEELEKIAYLTFDDGPSEITPDILDTLKNKKAKATFFLVETVMLGFTPAFPQASAIFPNNATTAFF